MKKMELIHTKSSSYLKERKGGKMTGALGMQTLATNMQTTAQMRLNAAMTMNPYGAVIALVVVALTSALYLFSKSSDEATEKAKSLAEANAEISKEVSKEKNELMALVAVAKSDTSRSKRKSNKAYQ